MEKRITEQEKQNLIAEIWSANNGRRETNKALALFVSLDSPRPNLGELTGKMLEALLESPDQSLNWAEDWGRVVVCVSPGSELGCRLVSTTDEAAKRFVVVQTTQILETRQLEELLETVPKGNAGTISINRKPTTIEAFLISYVHLVDELIWSHYRQDLRVSGRDRWPILYGDCVDIVRRNRFLTGFVEEDEILQTKLTNTRASVRLYGSGVNKDVLKVMGVVVVHDLFLPTFD